MPRTAATILLLAFLAPPWLACARASEITERVLKVPVKFDDMYRKTIAREITVTVFEERGRAPYPLLVLNHGRAINQAGRQRYGRVRLSEASKYFASLGYAVWVPTRIGYGVSGTDEDPEYSGECGNKDYPPAYAAATEQVLQVIDYDRRQPQIDGSRIVAVGQSFGGTTSIALAARGLPGLLATVNFAGGGGGNPDTRPGNPCEPYKLAEMFAGYGRSSRIPTLWIYTENDRYAGPRYTKSWYEAFRAQGGAGEFVLLPPFGEDGHSLFSRGMPLWKPIVERFLVAQVPTKEMKAQ